MAENENLTAEQEKQINEAYDKMLNAADTYKDTGEQSQEAYDNLKKELSDAALEKTTDELAKGMAKFCKGESEHPTNPTTDKKNPLTEEELEKVMDKLDDIRNSDPLLSSIANMPSNTGSTEAAPNVINYDGKDTTTKEVRVTIDPESGENRPHSNLDDVEPADVDLNDYLNMESYDTDKVDITTDAVSESVRREYRLSGEEDVQKLVEVLKKVQAGEKDEPFYNMMPKGVQEFVDVMCIENGILNKSLRNTVAVTVANMIINEIAADKFQIDVSKVIDNEIKKSGADISSLYSDMIIGKKEKLYEAAAKVESEKPDEAELLRNIGDACEESYMMTGFADAIKNHKIKIKKFEIEKPSRVVTGFYAKYEKSNLGINDVWDITYCIPRHLATASTPVTPDKITKRTVIAFTIAFCKYCMNMTVDSITDHVFMYYFIKNILYLDALPSGDKPAQFGQDLIDRIKAILEDIHDIYGF